MKHLWLPYGILLSLTLTGCLPRPERPTSTKSSSIQGASKETEASSESNDTAADTTTSGDAAGTTNPDGTKTDAGVIVKPAETKDPVVTSSATPSTPSTPSTPATPAGPAVQQSPRFSELTFLTAHNAFVNNADAGQPWIAPNQSRSLQFQLENGVTAIMIDLHPEKEGIDGTGPAKLCHEHCYNPAFFKVPYVDNTVTLPGMYFPMEVITYFKTINTFMEKNPNAILTVFLENYVTHGMLQDALNAAPGFKAKIFNPWAYQVKEKGWPRIDALIKDNKRILVISDHGGNDDLGVVFGPDFTNENYWSMGKPTDTAETLNTDCKTRWDEHPLNRVDPKFAYLFVMNNFRDIPALGPVRDDNNVNFLRTRIYTKCASVAEKKPNYLAVDHFDEADWGARKMVAELNEVAVLLYKETGLHGTLQMLKPGKYLTKDLTFGDNQIASLRVFAHTRVKLYEDDNFKKLLVELTEDSRDLGAAAKKASSIEITHE